MKGPSYERVQTREEEPELELELGELELGEPELGELGGEEDEGDEGQGGGDEGDGGGGGDGVGEDSSLLHKTQYMVRHSTHSLTHSHGHCNALHV
jgi:hypothetical protein